jgi:4-carboxymuconolactone decarboxylase
MAFETSLARVRAGGYARAMSSKSPKSSLPKHYTKFQKAFPAVATALEQLGVSLKNAGPLDAKTAELIRLVIAIGGRSEGAVHSHTRRALQAGATPDEIRHTVLLAMTGIGFPSAMAAMSWVEDLLER